MAFIGNQPTAVPLTSSQLADGLITTAKLASTSVTTAKVNTAAITTDKLDLISTVSVPAVTAKGTPSVSDGYIQLNCEQNSHGIKLKSPPHAAGANYTLTFPSALGTTGQAIITNSTGVLSFATVGASAGQIIQVLGAIETTQRSTTSASFVTASNTLSVSITPSSASNKIAIFVSHYYYSDSYSYYTIFRDATNLGGTNGLGLGNGLSGTLDNNISYNFLDSPSTTSSITYQVYMRRGGSGNTYLGGNNITSQIIVMEIKG